MGKHSDVIDHEAMKVWANAHPEKSLPSKDITLKTTQTFLKNTSE